jgi:hypothetical protein
MLVPDEVLFENDWVTVLDRGGWTVVRDMNGLGVALLPYRIHQGQDLWYLGRLEPCPSHGPLVLPSCITGGIEEGETPEQCAVKELKEEAGYAITRDHLIPLGEVWPSKLVEMRVLMYAVNVTGMAHSKPQGDGSVYEALAENAWYDPRQALKVPDAVWGTMILRLRDKLGL